LKQQPLTYLTAPTNSEGTAVQSTLRVSVNGVLWQERPHLLDSAPDAEHYTTREDDRGVTVVMFGDGRTAARPPGGRNNIRAQHRKGIGSAGNVDAGDLSQLIDSLPGLLRARNPQPSAGGTEPDTPEDIRTRAPASVLTFGRAVAASDYAVLARQFPGIAKAEAIWLARDEQFRAVANPYVQLTVAAANRVALAQQVTLRGALRAFLDAHRDPNVPLRIVDFAPVYVDVAVVVDIDARFPHEATLARVNGVLGTGVNADGSRGYFAFESLRFGESLHLSSLYAAMQRIPGVTSARVIRFRRLPDDAADPLAVREHIFVRPTELAMVQNDPSDPARGLLSITAGARGFADL
jgi:predicted phage baseplate assembly protein